MNNYKNSARLGSLLLASMLCSITVAQDIVVRRDAEGNTFVNATRVDEQVRIDGTLDEAIYRQIAPLSNFIQQIPNAGAPANEKTEAWIYFDDDNLYVAARVYESVPESEWIANEMRRDTFQLRTNDSFSVLVDTYLDRRNGSAFLVTPIGGFPISPSPMKATVVAASILTGMSCGIPAWGASMAAGLWRWKFPFARCAMNRA
jgi:hypothetical protein